MEESTESVARPTAPRLARTSAVRLLADLVGLVAALGTSVVTARALGVSGKGALASLLYTAAIASYVCALGLGDAAVVIVGRRKAALSTAVGTTVTALSVSVALGIVMLWLVAGRELGFDPRTINAVTIMSVAFMPCAVLGSVLVMLLNSQERVVLTSCMVGAGSLSTLVCTLVLVWPAHLGIAGAAAGAALGSATTGIGLLVPLRRSGTKLRPTLDRDYLRVALKLGLPIEAAYVLVALAQRADQLVVLHLMGTHPAGRYSVALTAGQLPLYVPLAIALAGFARLAYLSESDSMIVLGGMCRIGTAGALISTLVAAPLLPIAIPVFFGSAFSQAVVPALILLPGGVLWSLQWILGRAATARSQPSLLVQSFGLTLATMVI
ncbi:MAG: oligosaccharide flippase family protein, partial [Acidimicrobiales bacterium]